MKSLTAFREACRHPDAWAEVERALGRDQLARVEEAAAVIAAAADALERSGRPEPDQPEEETRAAGL